MLALNLRVVLFPRRPLAMSAGLFVTIWGIKPATDVWLPANECRPLDE